MAKNEPNGAEIARRPARQWLSENEKVPLALIAVEVGEPVELVADHLGDAVQLDDSACASSRHRRPPAVIRRHSPSWRLACRSNPAACSDAQAFARFRRAPGHRRRG
ncbi:MAG TPA: hypothetical protein VFT76_04040 [Actinomycetota bacterium]|nr:hypothetical protein [Actinomycetota bacterium]